MIKKSMKFTISNKDFFFFIKEYIFEKTIERK